LADTHAEPREAIVGEPAPAQAGGPAQRRRYDSRLRRERADQTRESIVEAGLELAHELPVWDWRGLTIRAAAGRAGVSERTVYRHFPSERDFHDAVMLRLEGQAGVTLEELRLADIAEATARVFAHVASFPLVVRTPLDPTLSAADQRRRTTLLNAVTQEVSGWPEAERKVAAGMLDVLWSVMSYERLITAWDLTPEQATTALTWTIGLVEAAIKQGRGPGPGQTGTP
jgi:AcrR family transcriptional regulator